MTTIRGMLNLLKAIILNKDHLLNCCMPSSSLLSVQWLNQVHYRVCCFCILILYSLFSVMLLWYLIRCDRHYEQMTSLTKCSKSPFGSPAASVWLKKKKVYCSLDPISFLHWKRSIWKARIPCFFCTVHVNCTVQ
jgi:hypothetical protein